MSPSEDQKPRSSEELAAAVVELVNCASGICDPVFYGMNRFNHGVATGLAKAIEIMTGIKASPIDVARYAEQAVSDNALGYEAIMLLKQMLENPSDVGLIERSRQLVEVFDFNRKAEAIKSLAQLGTSGNSCTLTLLSGKSIELTSMRGLISIRDVRYATDPVRKGWFFLSFVTCGENPIRLMAQHGMLASIGGESKADTELLEIGTLSNKPVWMNLRHVESCKDHGR